MVFQFQKDKHLQRKWPNLKFDFSCDLYKGGQKQSRGEFIDRDEIFQRLVCKWTKFFLYFFIVFLAWNLIKQPECCQTSSGS